MNFHVDFNEAADNRTKQIFKMLKYVRDYYFKPPGWIQEDT